MGGISDRERGGAAAEMGGEVEGGVEGGAPYLEGVEGEEGVLTLGDVVEAGLDDGLAEPYEGLEEGEIGLGCEGFGGIVVAEVEGEEGGIGL